MLISYSSYFVAYLLDNLQNKDNIIRIILFGSVAKNEATKESDIDIFIEVKTQTKSFEVNVKKIENEFYKSREVSLFKSKGINNKLNIKIGKIKDWEDLYKSIASTGIILYGPYEAKEMPLGVNHFIIIFWDKIEKNRGSLLNKLYGFKIKDKRYEGLLSKFNGKKIGKSCVMFPIQYKNDLFKLLKEYKVNAKSIEVFN